MVSTNDEDRSTEYEILSNIHMTLNEINYVTSFHSHATF